MTLDTHRRRRLADMGIVYWRRRESPGQEQEPPRAPPPEVQGGAVELQQAPLTQQDDLDALRARVRDCTQCELHQTRTQTVFGVGDPRAALFVIGEAPGADEDAQGEPFVGRAGQLLNAMLAAIGLGREQVYIANILKCRPPNNRDPRPEEVACCRGYLESQIERVAPRLILALGRVAAQNLLEVSTPIGKMRGSEFHLPGSEIPVLVTYHPAYLLRSPREKRKVWEDLKQVAALLEG